MNDITKHIKSILIVFLIGVAAFSGFKYYSSLKEKDELENALGQIKAQVSDLESEKQSLLENIEKEKEIQQKLGEENAALKDTLKTNEEQFAAQLAAQEERLIKQGDNFAEVRKEIEALTSQIGLLKAENTALREEKDGLDTQLTQVSQEKEALNARLSSVSELKKTIKELKKQVRTARKEIKKEAEIARIIEGNRGYLMRNGKPTYSTKVKIEVKPLSPSQ